jgi:hypothetical protein
MVVLKEGIMAKEVMGSVTRTLVSAVAGVGIGLLVDKFQVTPDTVEHLLIILEKIVDSLQGLLSILAIVIVQGWSIHQKMAKNKQLTEITMAKNDHITALKKEIKYND